MRIVSIRNLKENNSRLRICGKIGTLTKFLQFEQDSKSLIIWKIHLMDYTGRADFFSDEKTNLNKTNLFSGSNVKLIFYRGKKKFICRQYPLKFKDNFFQKVPDKLLPNISLLEYKMI